MAAGGRKQVSSTPAPKASAQHPTVLNLHLIKITPFVCSVCKKACFSDFAAVRL